MRLSELTPTKRANLLARAHAADHGEGDDAPSAAERTALADSLGCHEEMRAAAFAVWYTELEGVTEDEAASWLDVEFTEPCHEERAVEQVRLHVQHLGLLPIAHQQRGDHRRFLWTVVT